MQAKSIQGKTPAEIHRVLKECLSNEFKPTLALVFPSIKKDIEAVSEVFNSEGIQMFGATTSGEFVSIELVRWKPSLKE